MKVEWVFLPFLLISSIAPSGAAQSGQEQVSAEKVSRAQPSSDAAHGITFDVVVTDKSGAAVSGLGAADFKLLDSKHPQDPASILEAHGMTATADPPVEAIVMLDAVNEDFRAIANDRQWLEKLFKANGGELPLPTSLMMLTEQGVSAPAEATRDGSALLNQLNNTVSGLRTIKSSTGFWGAVEKRQISLQALGRVTAGVANIRGRKLLIWIGPGWPALSSANVDTTGITPKEQEALYGTIAEMSTALWQSRITLYDIDTSSGSMETQFMYQNYVKGADAPKHVENGDLMLQVLAVQSGGSIQYGNDLPGLIARCMADSKAFYVVHYAMPPAAHANEYHSIEMRVDKPGLKVRSRTLYYAQP